MYIRRLEAKNFRNYTNLSMDFCSGLNVITGQNSVGKTNIIEAISITSNLRSFRGIPDSEIIKWGEDYYYCCSIVNENESEKFEVGCSCISNRLKKRVKIDGNQINTTSNYYGKLLTVILSPDDINIIVMTPEHRRRYFDSIISKVNIDYFNNLRDFKKILNSRNILLKKIDHDQHNQFHELDVWDNLFANKVFYIIKKRTEFINKFNQYFKKAFCEILKVDNPPNLEYTSSLKLKNSEEIIKKLKRQRKRDLFMGSTYVGPQRDDYAFISENRINFKNFASQSEKRIASISLKIAEYEFIEKESGRESIILIDDIFSELDKKRLKNIIDLLKKKKQIIITVVNNKLISEELFESCKIFKIESKGFITE